MIIQRKAQSELTEVGGKWKSIKVEEKWKTKGKQTN
jgi:hypothetical protein